VVDAAWPVLERIGLAEGASRDRLRFDADLTSVVSDADFVQENGPERLDVKRDLIARIDASAGDDVLIASSTSGILISELQTAARRPGRVLVGHPFNPPHLIPLVEVVGGAQTAPEAIDRALRFYQAVGKKPILIRREVKGHVANRLQAALWREAFSLIERGVATVADVDAAIAHGPGLRWALLGPFLNLHLSGGAGGIAHAIDHLGPPIEDWWRDLGEVTFTEALKTEAVDGVDDELQGRSLPAMVQARDDVLLSLLALKANADQLP
jgi:3-hydroxyacyl-CoA dehydrogenase